jgi:hypothetical protein
MTTTKQQTTEEKKKTEQQTTEEKKKENRVFLNVLYSSNIQKKKRMLKELRILNME